MSSRSPEVCPESEFGKGLTYCLGLFLAHAERWSKDSGAGRVMGTDRPGSWFNSASDHLYELQIPEVLPESLRIRLANLQHKSLVWGHGYLEPQPVDSDVDW